MKSIVLAFTFATLACVGSAAEVVDSGAPASAAAPERTGPLKCFQCNSFVDPACADDFDAGNHAIQTNFAKDCPSEATYCKKVKMWFNLNGETRIMRGCGVDKREYKQPCYQSRADDHIVDTCQCDEAECNPAPLSAAPPALVAILGAAALVLRA